MDSATTQCLTAAVLPLTVGTVHAEVRLPYLDQRLVEFLLSLPFEEYGTPGFHDEVIATYYRGTPDTRYARKTHPRRGFVSTALESAKMTRALLRTFAADSRILYYFAESVFMVDKRPIYNPFARLFPLIQAQHDLQISSGEIG